MEQLRLWGTIVNALAVAVGALIGMGIKQLMGKKQHPRMEEISNGIFLAIGLCILAIGISGTIKASVNDQIQSALSGSYVGSPENVLEIISPLAGDRTLVVILSMIVGSVIGHLCNLDRGINLLGEKLELIAKKHHGSVAQGFVSASLLCCVGSMTVVGALNSGLQCDHTMLYTKAVLDLITALVLAISLGIGVLFSSAFVFVFEGSITLLAQWVAPYLSNDVITCMSVVGSILIIGLGLNMLQLTKLKIMNYIPAIVLPAFFIPLADWLARVF